MQHKNYELLGHTADIGIRVRGETLRELFRNAALALFDIIAEKINPKDAGRQSVRIAQKADNLEELLVNWLNELLSLSAVRELIFEDFQIEKIDENNLEVVAYGRDIKNYKINVEVKAATYHNLRIDSVPPRCLAEIIFDV